jgi:hypothetical protein
VHSTSLLSNIKDGEKGNNLYRFYKLIILIFAKDMSFVKSEIDEKAGGFSVITGHCHVITATPLTAYTACM